MYTDSPAQSIHSAIGGFQTDFGGVKRYRASVVQPVRSTLNVLDALAQARSQQLSVTIQGAGHSFRGQSLSSGGMQMRNYSKSADVTFLEDGLIEVSSRSSWRFVERSLNQAGRQSPVLTDYLDLSVGGTLSVGGMGLASITQGFQVDHVVKLKLIQPDGRVLWCSREENSELFRFALAGMGQVGFIDRVIMGTEPFRLLTHSLKRVHRNVGEMMTLIAELAAPGSGVEHFNGYIGGNEIASEYGYFSNSDTLDRSPLAPNLQKAMVMRSETDATFKIQDRRDSWMAEFPDHFQIWTDYIFTYENAVKFMAYLEPLMEQDPLNEALKAIYVLILRRPENAVPFAFLPAPPGDFLVSIGLYTMVNCWNPTLLAKTLPILKEALATCQAMEGRPYLYGFNEMDEAMKIKFYGSDYHRLQVLRQDHGLMGLNPESF
ncbi:MAG: FAD-binding protein [Alkalinema sp. RU_4_3]|nr:FAD-binding protein [Alkalinema sp. RU_4_3]